MVVVGASPSDYLAVVGHVIVPASRAPNHEADGGITPRPRARHNPLMLCVHIPDLHPGSPALRSAAMLSQRQFARQAGVTRWAIMKARREGCLVTAASGALDPAHPVNAAFLASHAPGATSAAERRDTVPEPWPRRLQARLRQPATRACG